MPTSTATVSTSHADRYLRQLCRHFDSHLPVFVTGKLGRVTFPTGTCQICADPSMLTLTATSEIADLQRLEQLVGNHLARFAFRENPVITWQRAA
ncbi:MAG: DUF2218 domain-containing protein [Pseudomonadota bacterium]